MKIIICAWLGFMSLGSFFQESGDISVNIHGLRSGKGKCIVYLYNNKEGFPTKAANAFKTASAPVSGNSSSLSFHNLKPGGYAVSVVHDENDNGKMDTNFIGMPKEGFGSSNNPKTSFGPPGFNESRISLGKNNQVLHITIKYL